MNKLHTAFSSILKVIFGYEKCSFAVTVKQPIVSMKQPIIFPLTPLYNVVKFAYA